MGELSFLDGAPGRNVTKPQKRSGGDPVITVDDLLTGDDVQELTALKRKLAEALARTDIHERDLKAVSVEYRAVREELKAAKLEAESRGLGKGKGSGAGPRGLDDDI